MTEHDKIGQEDGQTERQTDKQADRQEDRMTDTQTDTNEPVTANIVPPATANDQLCWNRFGLERGRKSR